MKKHQMIAAVVLVLGAGVAVSAVAMQQDEGLMPPRLEGMLVRHIEHRLNLSEDQRQKIKTILRTEKPTIQSLAERVHAERELMEEQPYDEAVVRRFVEQHEATVEDVIVEREKVRAEVQAVLTPEQRKQAAAIRETLYGHFVERLAMLGDQI
jgi:periplasmic protein CpxP/Spy